MGGMESVRPGHSFPLPHMENDRHTVTTVTTVIGRVRCNRGYLRRPGAAIAAAHAVSVRADEGAGAASTIPVCDGDAVGRVRCAAFRRRRVSALV